MSKKSDTTQDQENVLRLPDKTSFKWLILNLLGHDFYHDYNSIEGRSAVKIKGQGKIQNPNLIVELEVLLANLARLLDVDIESIQDFGNLSVEQANSGGKLNQGGGMRRSVVSASISRKRKAPRDSGNAQGNTRGTRRKIQDSDLKVIERMSDIVILDSLPAHLKSLMSSAEYAILKIKENRENIDLIPLISTLKTVKGKRDDGGCSSPTKKVCRRVVTIAEYDSYISKHWIPVVDIQPYQDGIEVYPTFGEIIKYSGLSIINRINEIKGEVAKEIGLLTLAPIFSEIVNFSLLAMALK